jgi:DNA polymerase III delta prime subunit
VVVGLYGRARAVELVREWLPRPAGNLEEDRGRRPVLLFEGGPGSGKTAVLDSLAGQLSGQAPYAHIDLKTVGNQLDTAAIPQLLAALAF